MKSCEENSGRILRVKSGYNPNSSSIGSDISTFLIAAAGACATAVVVVNILSAARQRILDERNQKKVDQHGAGASGESGDHNDIEKST